METIKILLVDDHALFRSGLASLLGKQEDFEVVGEASDGREALEKAKALMPDVILMDIYMPGQGGLETTGSIKQVLPYTKIIILTVSDQDHDLFQAIKSGAHGYLMKRIEPQDLFEMIRGVFQGDAPISRSTATKILAEFAKGGDRKRVEPAPHERLSEREQEVLVHLTEGASNKEIANALSISENTVKNHLKNILEKLHLENRVQAAVFALRQGLVRSDDVDA